MKEPDADREDLVEAALSQVQPLEVRDEELRLTRLDERRVAPRPERGFRARLRGGVPSRVPFTRSFTPLQIAYLTYFLLPLSILPDGLYGSTLSSRATSHLCVALLKDFFALRLRQPS